MKTAELLKHQITNCDSIYYYFTVRETARIVHSLLDDYVSYISIWKPVAYAIDGLNVAATLRHLQ